MRIRPQRPGTRAEYELGPFTAGIDEKTEPGSVPANALIAANNVLLDEVPGLTVLRGIRTVEKMQLPGDKQIKADPMVASFMAGNVFIKKAPWNEEFLKCVGDFPSGEHDDHVDALAVMYHMCVDGNDPSAAEWYGK